MARMDDYRQAKRIAVETLRQRALSDLSRESGFDEHPGSAIRVPFLDRVYRVGYPDFEFTDMSGNPAEIPIYEQVLILHYLMGAHGVAPAGHWIPYRDIPGASLYHGVFIKRAVDPLRKVFGRNLPGFSRAAALLNGSRIAQGDLSFAFSPFPAVPLQLIVWEGDDEFPAEAGILFDRTVSGILSPEDVAWLSGMLVYRLITVSG